jgi:hypothetical protein
MTDGAVNFGIWGMLLSDTMKGHFPKQRKLSNLQCIGCRYYFTVLNTGGIQETTIIFFPSLSKTQLFKKNFFMISEEKQR